MKDILSVEGNALKRVFLKSLSRVVDVACFLVGWIGNLTIFRLRAESQIRILKGLGKIVAFIIQVPVFRSAFHSLQEISVDDDFERHKPLQQSNQSALSQEDAVVLFSGGKDSLYVAWELSQRFNTIHLLTLRLGTIEYAELSESSVRLLENSQPKGKFLHHYVDGNELARRFLFDQQKDHREQFGYTVVGDACIPCRVVMETMAILFCKKHDVRWVGFGLNPSSRDTFNQSLCAVQMGEKFAGRHGVNLIYPLWENPKINPLDELYRSGVVPDHNIGKPYEFGFKNATQGFCPFGIWCDINMRSFSLLHGVNQYDELCVQYRRHIEQQCDVYLSEVCSI